jgi:ABC-type proline/glycine betaine transport system permease subunit
MENLDIIILTAVVVTLYSIFLTKTFNIFSKMVNKATKENLDREAKI